MFWSRRPRAQRLRAAAEAVNPMPIEYIDLPDNLTREQAREAYERIHTKENAIANQRRRVAGAVASAQLRRDGKETP